MNKICTSIEQSKKLMELGIDVNTADMCWSIFKTSWGDMIYTIVAYPMLPNQGKGIEKTYEYLPAWSLSALFDILPNDEVTSTTVTRGGWNIEPAKYLDIWFAEYETENHGNDFSLSANNPIDAAFKMICQLKEKNLL